MKPWNGSKEGAAALEVILVFCSFSPCERGLVHHSNNQANTYVIMGCGKIRIHISQTLQLWSRDCIYTHLLRGFTEHMHQQSYIQSKKHTKILEDFECNHECIRLTVIHTVQYKQNLENAQVWGTKLWNLWLLLLLVYDLVLFPGFWYFLILPWCWLHTTWLLTGPNNEFLICLPCLLINSLTCIFSHL